MRVKILRLWDYKRAVNVLVFNRFIFGVAFRASETEREGKLVRMTVGREGLDLMSNVFPSESS